MLRSEELRQSCPVLLPTQATWPISWPCTTCYHSSSGRHSSTSWDVPCTFFMHFPLWSCPQGVQSSHALPVPQKALWFYGPTCLPNQWGTVTWESVSCSGSSQLSWTVMAVAFEPQETVPYIHWCRKDALGLITSQGKVCQTNLHLVPVTVLSPHLVSARLLSYCSGQCTWFLFSAWSLTTTISWVPTLNARLFWAIYRHFKSIHSAFAPNFQCGPS